jgi:putative membrane protein
MDSYRPSALASGAGAHSLLEGIVSVRLNRIVASFLVLFAVFCFGAGVWRELLANMAQPASAVARIAPIILGLASSALMLISLAVMVGVWHSQ